MRKFYTICVLSIMIFSMLLFCSVGCAETPNIVSETPIDTDFIAAHDEITTEYRYKYSVWEGEFKLLPFTETVHYPDCYMVKYEVIYDNGKKRTVWREVDKHTYEDTKTSISSENTGEDYIP